MAELYEGLSKIADIFKGATEDVNQMLEDLMLMREKKKKQQNDQQNSNQSQNAANKDENKDKNKEKQNNTGEEKAEQSEKASTTAEETTTAEAGAGASTAEAVATESGVSAAEETATDAVAMGTADAVGTEAATVGTAEAVATGVAEGAAVTGLTLSGVGELAAATAVLATAGYGAYKFATDDNLRHKVMHKVENVTKSTEQKVEDLIDHIPK